MKKPYISMLTAILGLLSGCYMGMTGRVIDAETQQPIEGAVVLVQWTEAHGLGLTHHSVYKIAETETDSNGSFSLPGAYSPFIDAPDLVIYKQGYIAWRNDTVFPNLEKRKDYDIWQHGFIYKLVRFKEGLSRYKHFTFLSSGIIGASITKTPNFEKATTFEHKSAEPAIEIIRQNFQGSNK